MILLEKVKNSEEKMSDRRLVRESKDENERRKGFLNPCIASNNISLPWESPTHHHTINAESHACKSPPIFEMTSTSQDVTADVYDQQLLGNKLPQED